MHPLKLVRTVITSSEKVMILNAMWKQYMTGSKRWHLKLALEHLWDRKKWKFQNSFSAVNVLKHSTHLQTWKGTCDASKRQQLNWRGRYHTEKTVWFVCVELLFLMPCLLRCNWLIELWKASWFIFHFHLQWNFVKRNIPLKHCQRHNGPRNWLRDLD